MSQELQELIVRLRAELGDYQRQMAQAVQGTSNVAKAQAEVTAASRASAQSLSGLGNEIGAAIASYATWAAAIGAVTGAVKASDAKYTHDNQTRKTCPDCGKFLLLVKGKRGEILVCPDRECGYRKSVTQVTNARCPNCFKKMELRGEGENQMFACVCGYREKLSAFQERRKSAGAGKRDVAKYLQQQKDDKPVNSGMADALAKWLEKNQK